MQQQPEPVRQRANETGNIYEPDIKDLQERLEEIWTDMKGGAGAPVQYSVRKELPKNPGSLHIDIVVLCFSKQYNKDKKGGVLL